MGFDTYWFSDEDKLIPKELIVTMTDVISHRGPDDYGCYINKNIGLGFRRLSIIDLEGGHQPLTDCNNKAWIVFNGVGGSFSNVNSPTSTFTGNYGQSYT